MNTLIQRGYAVLTWVRTHRAVRWVINIGLALALVVFISLSLGRDWQQLSQAQVTIQPGALALSFALYGVNYLLLVQAWHWVVRRFARQVSFVQNALLYSYSHLTRYLPTPAWFLTSRVVLYAQQGMRKRAALITTAVETLVNGLTGLALFGLLMVDAAQPLTLLWALLVIPLSIIILRPRWLELRWVEGGEAPQPGLRRVDVAAVAAVNLALWLVSAVFFQAVILSVTPLQPLTLADLLRTWVLSNLVAIIGAYTLGGIGVLREFSLTLLLNRWYSPAMGLVITVASRLIITVAGVVWALLVAGCVRLMTRGKAEYNQGE